MPDAVAIIDADQTTGLSNATIGMMSAARRSPVHHHPLRTDKRQFVKGPQPSHGWSDALAARCTAFVQLIEINYAATPTM